MNDRVLAQFESELGVILSGAVFSGAKDLGRPRFRLGGKPSPAAESAASRNGAGTREIEIQPPPPAAPRPKTSTFVP